MLATNIDLQASVRQALDWDLEADARHIVVSTETGSVTLSGYVPSFLTKARAIKSVIRIFGVRAVADELEVRLQTPVKNEDSTIAAVIARTFQSNVHFAKYNLKATVSHGRVTLTGNVDWDYERDEAKHAVARIRGVVFVVNDVAVLPRVASADVQSHIANTLTRHGTRKVGQFRVGLSGSTGVLDSHLRSLEEARAANTTASRVPGITQVEEYLCNE